MKKAFWIVLSALLLSFWSPICQAKPVEYKVDKFTGQKNLEANVWLYKNHQPILTEASSFRLHLFHRVGESPKVSLIVDFAGGDGVIQRTNEKGEYTGTPELLLLLDGERSSVPITKVIRLKDAATQNYAAVTMWNVSVGNGYVTREQGFLYELEVPVSLLQKIASAKKTEASLREHFSTGMISYDLEVLKSYKRDIVWFLEAYNAETPTVSQNQSNSPVKE